MSKDNIKLASVANGKPAEDLTCALGGLVSKLFRFRSSSLDPDEKRNIVDTAKRLVRLREKIACSGMDTVLTDDEVRLFEVFLEDNVKEAGTHRLADFARHDSDVENLAAVIPQCIDSLYKDAELNEDSYWECGGDKVVADYDQLRAVALRILHNAISQYGMDTMLSSGQVQIVIEMLFKSLAFHMIEGRWLAAIQMEQRNLKEEDRWKVDIRPLRDLWATI